MNYPTYNDMPDKVSVSESSILNLIFELESELEVFPGTINDLETKLSPVLMPDLGTEADSSNIKPITNNSPSFDRLADILSRLRGVKSRIHDITDRVQI